jgi:hypothetical protein
VWSLYDLNDATENKFAPHFVDDAQTPHVRSPFSTPRFLCTFVRWVRGQLPGLDFKDLLPFSFAGLNGGIVCGNMANPNILVVEFSRADGIFGAVPVRRPAVLYCFSRRLSPVIFPVKVFPRPVQATSKY